MKLSETKAAMAYLQERYPDVKKRGAALEALMRREGLLNQNNIYQELEMDSPYVDTHEDLSDTESVVQLHSHTFFELLYCRSGNLQYLLGSDRYRIQRGDILLIPPGVSHRPLFLEKLAEPYSRYVLWLSAEFADLLRQVFPGLPTERSQALLLRTGDGAGASAFEEYFRHGCQEAARREAGWQAAVAGNTVQLLVYIGRAQVAGQGYVPPAEKPELLDAVLNYIETHLAERITLEGTARRFLVSESTISQLFRNKMKVSFYRCVTQRRLIAAKAHILEGETLERVGEAVGFADYSTFYRAFKREYGISPTQFRRLQKSPPSVR